MIGTWLSHVNSFKHYFKAMETEAWSPLMDFTTMGTDSVGRRMYVLFVPPILPPPSIIS